MSCFFYTDVRKSSEVGQDPSDNLKAVPRCAHVIANASQFRGTAQAMWEMLQKLACRRLTLRCFLGSKRTSRDRLPLRDLYLTLPSRCFLLIARSRATAAAASSSARSSAYQAWRCQPMRTAHPSSSKCWQLPYLHLREDKLAASRNTALSACKVDRSFGKWNLRERTADACDAARLLASRKLTCQSCRGSPGSEPGALLAGCPPAPAD